MALPVCGVLPLKRADIEQVRRWRNQERIRSNMYSSALISAEQQERWFAGLVGDASRRYLLFLMDGRPVGCLYYTAIHHGEAHLGYYLGEERIWPGSGLLLELIALDYAFARLELHTLLAEVLEGNRGPQKIHDLFGFERLGSRPAAWRDGQPVTAQLFRYRHKDWSARRPLVLQGLPRQIRDAALLLDY